MHSRRATSSNRRFTVKELAEYLRVSTDFVYEHALELGGVKAGRKLLFSEADVQVWWESRRLDRVGAA